jgi:hypothetical protein
LIEKCIIIQFLKKKKISLFPTSTTASSVAIFTNEEVIFFSFTKSENRRMEKVLPGGLVLVGGERR